MEMFAAVQDTEQLGVMELLNSTTPPARTDKLNNKLAEELAASRSLLEPDRPWEDLLEDSRLQVNQAQDPVQLFTPIVQTYKQKQTDDLKAGALQRIRNGENPDDVIRNLSLMKQMFDESNSWDVNVVLSAITSEAPHEWYAAMNSAADSSPYAYIQKRMAEEGRDGVDPEDFADWAGVLVWPDITAESSSMREFISGNPKLFKADSIEEVGLAYQKLDPIQKQQFWEEVAPKMFDVFDGNDLKMHTWISMVQAFDPAYEKNFNLGMDVLTAAGGTFDALQVFKFMKTGLGAKLARYKEARGSLDAVRALRNAGQTDTAAAAALGRAAEQHNALEAAKNAAPINLEGTAVETTLSVDGIAPEIQARMSTKIERLRTQEDLIREARASAAEQKAAELDLWIETESAKTGGRKAADIQEELAALKSERDFAYNNLPQASLSKVADDLQHQGNAARQAAQSEAEANLLSLDTRIKRLQDALDAHESTKLARGFSRSLKAGRVPEEFADDIARAEKQAMDAWDNAAETAESVALRADAEKLRAELGIELQSNKRLGTEELIALKEEARRLGKNSDDASRARLEEIAARYQEHQAAVRASNDLRALNSGARPAKGTSASGAAKAPTSANHAPVPEAAPTEPVATVMPDTSKVTESITRKMSGYKDGTAFIDVARSTFIRNHLDQDRAAFVQNKQTLRSYSISEAGDGTVSIAYKFDEGVEVRTYKWELDSLGNWLTEDIANSASSAFAAIAEKTLTPTAVTSAVAKDLVSNFTLAGMQSSKIFNDMLKIAKGINKDLGLTRAEADRVEQLLLLGSNDGVVFDPTVLMGSNTILGRVHSVKEVAAYLQWRAFYDNLWSVHNNAIHRALHFAGYRELVVTNLADDVAKALTGRKAAQKDASWSVAVKIPSTESRLTVGTKTAKHTAASIKDDILMLDDAGLTTAKMNLDDIAEAEHAGWELLEVHKAAGRDGFIMIRQGETVKIDQLRKTVLHYHTGYMPRVYKPGYFFVKDARGYSTLGAFKGNKEASAWIKSQGKEGEYVVVRDHQRTPEQIQSDAIDGAGGLWFMPRRSEAGLTNPATGKPLEVMDVGQSTQMYLTSIAGMLPLNEYRTGVLGQYVRAVTAAARKNNAQGFIDPSDIVRSDIKTGDAGLDKTLKYTRDYILEHIGHRTPEESMMDSVLSAAIDKMEGVPVLGGGFRNAAMWGLHSDPIARAKGAVFHAYLGGFNLAQLFVQSMNATIAISAHPQYAIPALYDALKMRTILLMDKGAIDALSVRSGVGYGDVYDDLTKLGWYDREKVQAAGMLRSGYFDSIFRQGDYSSQLNGLGGYTMQGVRTVLRTGAIPFEEGELWARLVSFSIAKRQHLASTGSKVLRDEDIQSVVQESLRINLNMQKENAAWWQKGAMGVPTQFLQVYAKFLEATMGGLFGKTHARTGGRVGLSKAESARVLAGQLALFGAIGIPFKDQIEGFVAKGFGYETDTGQPDIQSLRVEHPGIVEAYEEGLMGAFLDVWGLHLDVSERFSLLASYNDNIVASLIEVFAKSDDRLGQDGLRLDTAAPVAGVGVRLSDRIHNMWTRAWGLTHIPDPSMEDVGRMVWDLATVFSSMNNIEKVAMWQQLGYLTSRAGNPTVRWDTREMNIQTQFGALIGLSTDVEMDHWRAQAESGALKDRKDTSAMLYRQAALAYMRGDEGLAAGYYRASLDMMNNSAEFAKMRVKESQKLMDGESADERTRAELFKAWLSGYDVRSDFTGIKQ